MLLTVQLTHEVSQGHLLRAVLGALGSLAIAVLVYGGLVYQLARWGHFRRLLSAEVADPADQDELFEPDAEPGKLTVLIPSYREDMAVVRQTVLSAALQDYPDRRVVILVDDPPAPDAPGHVAALDAVRGLPAQVHALVADPARELAEEAHAFARRTGHSTDVPQDLLVEEARWVEDLYERTAHWFDRQFEAEHAEDHTARLFSRLTFGARAIACRERAAEVAASRTAGTLTLGRLRRDHQRLACLFAVEVTVFERKRYANLSHEANKAMNLNSYIGLLGRRWQEVHRPDGVHLEPVPAPTRSPRPAPADPQTVIEVPASRWLLTLDADSLLVHDYSARLVQAMSRPEQVRTAVMQTPYSAVPGAPGPVERTAGATTDVMHVVHQGTTHFDATYWVGANALLRTDALADIATTEQEGSKEVTRFIQDRTVIEDTESTVDLVDAGWRLHNYPARLAYSATPADYGSLLIQRRRWANGGLIILPKLLRSYRRSGLRGRTAEAVMRVHYLISIATANLALLFLMFVPLELDVPVALLVGTSVPYFALYARDLRLMGRRRRELLEVYALNLLMLPVNLGGVVMSVRQALTGRRIPFGRTPKVSDRTAAPALYVASTLVLLALWAVGATVDAVAGRDLHAVLGGANAVLLAVAVTRYIGWRHALGDLTAPLKGRLRRGSSVRDDGECPGELAADPGAGPQAVVPIHAVRDAA
ncbi:glycosyltransferase family 2 protein [Geodermatophilus sp. SYSU D01105]